MNPSDPNQPSPGYMPQYMPQSPGQIMQRDAPNVANPGFNPAGMSKFQGYMGGLNSALNTPNGPAQQLMAGGTPPPPPPMMQGAGVHPGTPGGGMDPAALQNMLQMYQGLQPSGQLAMQMQAAGVPGAQQPAPVPGLLSRFQ